MKGVGILPVLVIVLALGVAVGLVCGEHNLDGVAQTSYTELRSMKEECEKDIPRSQNCEATIIYMPVAGY